MKGATSSVEFSFNKIMYKQIDRVAMGSPLGLALSNIFVGYHKKSYFLKHKNFQYASDMLMTQFATFDHKAEADEFLTKLNCLDPFLKFTFEKEKDKCLPFLDVYIERTNIGFETSVYWKTTETHWIKQHVLK